MKRITNQIILFVIAIVSFFSCVQTSYAADYGVVTADLNVRKCASTNTTTCSVVASLKKDAKVNLVNDTKYSASDGTCASGWYHVYYDETNTGYVCSSYLKLYTTTSYVNREPANTCEEKMNVAGFPDTYWDGLCTLQEKYPNWSFNAIITNLDWITAVNAESSCGTSYIQTTNSDYIDSTCTNQYGPTSSWKPASAKAVAYYMDPRNWLSENTIFQFEYLKYDNVLSDKYVSAVNSIVGGTDFYLVHPSIGTYTNTAGSMADVSPIFLAARMRQELGVSNILTNLYSGIFSDTNTGTKYSGYYNFFNYGVSDSCVTSSVNLEFTMGSTTYCGLAYAYKLGWNTPTLAIQGAANSLSSSYIAVGQHTGYLQKFNVAPTNSSNLYIHQYMTNIVAPSSESRTTYNSYNSLGVLSSAFSFYIPVYSNMDNTDYDNGGGATNEKEEDGKSTSSISAIIQTAGYNYKNGYISGIELDSKVSEIKDNLAAIAGSNYVTIKKEGGNEVTTGTIATGYKISITNSSGTEEIPVIIYGDTSGDGVINALDLLQVQKSILETLTLKGAYNSAADTNQDGKITALDLLQVQKNILETYKIVQK